VYGIVLGDFATDDYPLEVWMVFLISTLILTIIMLNLLIAIISAHHDEVDTDAETISY